MRIKNTAALSLAFAIALAGCSPAGGGVSSGEGDGVPAFGAPSSVASSLPDDARINPGLSSSSTQGEPTQSSESEQSGLDGLLASIEGYEAGTAGSSLKIYPVAVGLLNFSEENTLPDEAVSKKLEQYFATLTKERREAFSQSLEAADAAAKEILSGSDMAKGMLEDAGSPPVHESYDAARYSAFYKLIADSLKSPDAQK